MNKYRILPCVQLDTNKDFWLIQIKKPARGWMNCCEGSKAMVFDTEAEAVAKLKAFNESDAVQEKAP